MRPRGGVLAVAWLLAGLGCGGGEIEPVSGEVTLSLSAAMPQTGAVLVRIVGAVEAITPVGNLRVASAAVPGTVATRVVVTGSIGTGDLVRVRVPDVNALNTYSVVVEQAASGTDFSLLDPGGYGIFIRR